MDTDWIAFTNPHDLPADEFHGRVGRVRDWFTPLHPYRGGSHLLKLEDSNYELDHAGELTDEHQQLLCYATSPKRSVLFNVDPRWRPILRKVSAHGLATSSRLTQISRHPGTSRPPRSRGTTSASSAGNTTSGTAPRTLRYMTTPSISTPSRTSNGRRRPTTPSRPQPSKTGSPRSTTVAHTRRRCGRSDSSSPRSPAASAHRSDEPASPSAYSAPTTQTPPSGYPRSTSTFTPNRSSRSRPPTTTRPPHASAPTGRSSTRTSPTQTPNASGPTAQYAPAALAAPSSRAVLTDSKSPTPAKNQTASPR